MESALLEYAQIYIKSNRKRIHEQLKRKISGFLSWVISFREQFNPLNISQSKYLQYKYSKKVR